MAAVRALHGCIDTYKRPTPRTLGVVLGRKRVLNIEAVSPGSSHQSPGTPTHSRPLSSVFGTNKTVRTRIWFWLAGKTT